MYLCNGASMGYYRAMVFPEEEEEEEEEAEEEEEEEEEETLFDPKSANVQCITYQI